jgi:hypothetical protein
VKNFHKKLLRERPESSRNFRRYFVATLKAEFDNEVDGSLIRNGDGYGDGDGDGGLATVCRVESEEKAVEMNCKFRCKDGSCINR